MSLGWSGTFREGQWRAYRDWILKERKDAARRVATINAELQRIGQVVVYYGSDAEGRMTEQRLGFAVSVGSSLEKLIQAYVVQGGNPFDVSLYLVPDSIEIVGDDVYQEYQPYGGVVHVKNQLLGVGATDNNSGITLRKYWPPRTGQRNLQDTLAVDAVNLTRRWLGQTIAHRTHDLEARIIKLCDLREQLQQEIEQITAALGGVADVGTDFDPDLFDIDYSLSAIVTQIDSVFYQVDPDGVPQVGTIAATASPNLGGPVNPLYLYFMQDIPLEEDNTTL